MGKCRFSPKHKRVLKKGDSHYSGSEHKLGIRGHQWKGIGKNRKCSRCDKKSGSEFPGYMKEDRSVVRGNNKGGA